MRDPQVPDDDEQLKQLVDLFDHEYEGVEIVIIRKKPTLLDELRDEERSAEQAMKATMAKRAAHENALRACLAKLGTPYSEGESLSELERLDLHIEQETLRRDTHPIVRAARATEIAYADARARRIEEERKELDAARDALRPEMYNAGEILKKLILQDHALIGQGQSAGCYGLNYISLDGEGALLGALETLFAYWVKNGKFPLVMHRVA